ATLNLVEDISDPGCGQLNGAGFCKSIDTRLLKDPEERGGQCAHDRYRCNRIQCFLRGEFYPLSTPRLSPGLLGDTNSDSERPTALPVRRRMGASPRIAREQRHTIRASGDRSGAG